MFFLQSCASVNSCRLEGKNVKIISYKSLMTTTCTLNKLRKSAVCSSACCFPFFHYNTIKVLLAKQKILCYVYTMKNPFRFYLLYSATWLVTGFIMFCCCYVWPKTMAHLDLYGHSDSNGRRKWSGSKRNALVVCICNCLLLPPSLSFLLVFPILLFCWCCTYFWWDHVI